MKKELKYREEMVDTMLFEEVLDMVESGMSWVESAFEVGIDKEEVSCFIEECKEWKEEMEL